ncbi:ATP-binding protein [Bacillus coahuilensis]|uniref:ATP-binding protein n=1 Tax=Bacillus coahuilensis TaxID=408580 RepID=UPI00018512EE|nr:ATP-binding protein [Bacillus coahuilensis]
MSVIVVYFSFDVQSYNYDIRYSLVILAYAYFGPVGGIITSLFSIMTRLVVGEEWFAVIVGGMLMLAILTIVANITAKKPLVHRILYLSGSYIVAYLVIVPLLLNILSDQLFFHLVYLSFISLGVFIGFLLIESYEKMSRVIVEKNKMEQELESSEDKYRLIAENTSDLVVVVNKAHRITYVSPSHKKVLGLKGNLDFLTEIRKIIHPDDIEEYGRVVSSMFDEEGEKLAEVRLNLQGTWSHFESKCMGVKNDAGQVEHIIVTTRSIEERKQAEEYLLQKEKLSVVGELAAGVAHEIRNPLTTIKGFIQLYKDEQRYSEFDSLILEELGRIEMITSEMLSLGKPQAHHLKNLDIEIVVKETVEFLTPQARLLNIGFVLTKNVDTGKELIYGERNQLKQVFLNLFKNAMESMEATGGTVYCHISSEHNQCVMTIIDSGCGIPKEVLSRLGEPFYSLKEKGTGLGVMMCHRIIQQHKGTLSYTSEVGEGTKVEVILPIVHAEHSSS